MLRAFAVAGEEVLAAKALHREVVALVDSELKLPLGGHHRADVIREDIAKPVLRIDEVVAGIKVPVMLNNRVPAASLRIGTRPRQHAAPIRERRVEEINEVLYQKTIIIK